MVHNPWAWRAGEANDMRHTADVLDEIKEAIMNVYELKTGKDRQAISELMDKETWMSAKTAVAEGFADGILYVEEPEPAQAAYALSGLAIQNSVNEALRKFFELYQKHCKQDEPEEKPANSRVFDIRRRVNVREKLSRRNTHGQAAEVACQE